MADEESEPVVRLPRFWKKLTEVDDAGLEQLMQDRALQEVDEQVAQSLLSIRAVMSAGRKPILIAEQDGAWHVFHVPRIPGFPYPPYWRLLTRADKAGYNAVVGDPKTWVVPDKAVADVTVLRTNMAAGKVPVHILEETEGGKRVYVIHHVPRAPTKYYEPEYPEVVKWPWFWKKILGTMDRDGLEGFMAIEGNVVIKPEELNDIPALQALQRQEMTPIFIIERLEPAPGLGWQYPIYQVRIIPERLVAIEIRDMILDDVVASLDELEIIHPTTSAKPHGKRPMCGLFIRHYLDPGVTIREGSRGLDDLFQMIKSADRSRREGHNAKVKDTVLEAAKIIKKLTEGERTILFRDPAITEAWNRAVIIADSQESSWGLPWDDEVSGFDTRNLEYYMYGQDYSYRMWLVWRHINRKGNHTSTSFENFRKYLDLLKDLDLLRPATVEPRRRRALVTTACNRSYLEINTSWEFDGKIGLLIGGVMTPYAMLHPGWLNPQAVVRRMREITRLRNIPTRTKEQQQALDGAVREYDEMVKDTITEWRDYLARTATFRRKEWYLRRKKIVDAEISRRNDEDAMLQITEKRPGRPCNLMTGAQIQDFEARIKLAVAESEKLKVEKKEEKAVAAEAKKEKVKGKAKKKFPLLVEGAPDEASIEIPDFWKDFTFDMVGIETLAKQVGRLEYQIIPAPRINDLNYIQMVHQGDIRGQWNLSSPEERLVLLRRFNLDPGSAAHEWDKLLESVQDKLETTFGSPRVPFLVTRTEIVPAAGKVAAQIAYWARYVPRYPLFDEITMPAFWIPLQEITPVEGDTIKPAKWDDMEQFLGQHPEFYQVEIENIGDEEYLVAIINSNVQVLWDMSMSERSSLLGRASLSEDYAQKGWDDLPRDIQDILHEDRDTPIFILEGKVEPGRQFPVFVVYVTNLEQRRARAPVAPGRREGFRGRPGTL